MQMNEGYSDGAALLLLAQSYEKSGNNEQANLKYQKLVESYPDTEAAEEAKDALKARNSDTAPEEDEGDAAGSEGDDTE